MRLLSRLRHPFSSVSHGVGAALASVGSVVLLSMARSPLAFRAFALYGLSLVGLYAASCLYHASRAGGKREALLRKLDHTGIFLLIAGTYVPVCALALPPSYGRPFLVLEALLASFGILATFTLRRFPETLNVVLYLLMGWMAIPAIRWIGSNWPRDAIVLLVSGGILYTVGAVVFALDRPHLAPGRFSAHDLWHVFVLAGSGCHFALMATYVAHLSG